MNEVYIEIGHKIKMMREGKGIKQKFIAEEIGITPQFLCDIENGRRMPSGKTVEAICEFFEITLAEMFSNIFIEKMGYGWIAMPNYKYDK